MKAMLAATVASMLLAQASLADAFRWVDDAGGVHYGDSPPEGAAAGEVTPLDVYECNTPQCVEMEAVRAEQAREEVRALQDSFAPPAAETGPAPASPSYVNTIVREVYVSPFAVPVRRYHRRVPYANRPAFHGGGTRPAPGGRDTRTMSMPRY